MSSSAGLAEAMRFLRAVRDDEGLRARVGAVDPDDGGLERVVAIAAEAGFVFGVEDLREAHRHDWAMRSLRYRP